HHRARRPVLRGGLSRLRRHAVRAVRRSVPGDPALPGLAQPARLPDHGPAPRRGVPLPHRLPLLHLLSAACRRSAPTARTSGSSGSGIGTRRRPGRRSAAGRRVPGARSTAGGSPVSRLDSAVREGSSIDKALAVLEAIAEHHRVTDIAAATGVSKSTVHRILQSLVEWGFARSDGSGGYEPGPRILTLAGRVMTRFDPARQDRKSGG